MANLGQEVQKNLAKTDLAGRYGGEELTIVLPLTNLSGAFTIADKLRVAVAALQIPWEEETIGFRLALVSPRWKFRNPSTPI